jgi:hypothetical protein
MPISTGVIAVSYIHAPIRHPSGDIYAVKLLDSTWFTSINPPQVIGTNGSRQALSEEPGAGTRVHLAYDDKLAGALPYKALRGVKLLSLTEAPNLFSGYPLETLDN